MKLGEFYCENFLHHGKVYSKQSNDEDRFINIEAKDLGVNEKSIAENIN
ncbi:hypothetical protein PYS58_05415 [Chryseobacterium indologenes]|nr:MULTISPECIES: hypothetical protein [Chryseobacterium]MDM1557270.1 hypothetical protein [Chryseobacterium indologenes]WET50569.1 hypothetical protein PYS58_05415 [Chryseobacterium indologenes]